MTKVIKRASEDQLVDTELLPWVESRPQTKTIAPALFAKNKGSFPKKPNDSVWTDVQKLVEQITIFCHSNNYRTIGLLSATPGEGTSTITALVSLVLGAKESGLCLTIDTRLNAPTLHNYFGLPAGPGLVELMSQDISLNQALFEIADTNLTFLPFGVGNSMALEQIDPIKLKKLLFKLKDRFRTILLDIPPLITSAEGIKLSKLCDAVILVVQAETTRWDVITEAKELLERTDVEILGCILNRQKDVIPKFIHRSL